MSMSESKKDTEGKLRNQAERGEGDKYVLRLFVAGISTSSRKAIENMRKLCDRYLQGRYKLEIIDIYQNPVIARDGQIIATPTLIKELPEPIRRFVGDMSDTRKLLLGLDLVSEEE